MKQTIKTLVILLFWNTLFAQNDEQTKAVAVIENLTYREYYLPDKCYDKTEISFVKNSNRIVIKQTNYLGEDRLITSTNSVFLEDLDSSILYYDIADINGSLYVLIKVPAKNKTVEKLSVSINKSKSTLTNSTKEYLDYIMIGCTKSLSKNLAQKLVDSYQILFGTKKQIMTKLYK
jgi:hypothetical protein